MQSLLWKQSTLTSSPLHYLSTIIDKIFIKSIPSINIHELHEARGLLQTCPHFTNVQLCGPRETQQLIVSWSVHKNKAGLHL